MARWIFTFRSVEERPLSPEEIVRLRREIGWLRVRHVGFAVLTVLSFSASFLFFLASIGGDRLFWVGVLFFLIAGFPLLFRANEAKSVGLFHRRALRLGIVERFERVLGDDTVRRRWQSHPEPKPKEDDSEEEEVSLGQHWREEETFEERLAHIAGQSPDGFEAVGRDGVVLWVMGRSVRELLEPYVWEVPDIETT
ncbi:hypothetical protein EON79_13440 [bacterium]|nr:MAG: hypothetical protein EON79_13440 [bacterium]